jgi:hypothetical protein
MRTGCAGPLGDCCAISTEPGPFPQGTASRSAIISSVHLNVRTLALSAEGNAYLSPIKSTRYTARDGIPSDAEPTRGHEPAMPVYRYLILRPGRSVRPSKCNPRFLRKRKACRFTLHWASDKPMPWENILKPLDLLVSLDSTDCSASICDLSTT